MSAYKRCRPVASHVVGQPPQIAIHARDVDAPWVVGAVDQNIDRISLEIYLARLDYSLSGQADSHIYTLDARVIGLPVKTYPVIQLVNLGHLYDESDPSILELRKAAYRTLMVPIAQRPQVHVRIVTPYEALITRTVALTALRYAGTFHKFHMEVENSGKHPGTADVLVDALVGFGTAAAATAAAAAFSALSYESIRVTRLYDNDFRLAIANAA